MLSTSLKSTAIVSLRSTEMVDNIFSLDWNTLVQTQQMPIEEVSKPQEVQELVHDLLPQMP